MTREEAPGQWRLDAYFEAKPSPALVRAVAALAPRPRGPPPVAERIADQDWTALSQAGLEPIRAGRFFVHTPAHRHAVAPNAVSFEIEAGLAFGTGHHATTAGCLHALDRLKRTGSRPRTMIDVGTGTGLLAFAALSLWPAARAAASDIDPVAVAVTRANAARNRVKLGRGPGQLDTVTAAGLDHPRLCARAPYDLVIANILAAPLIALAPSIGAALAPSGRLILAGLLGAQARRVAATYRREGLRPLFTVDDAEWPTLVLRRRRG